MFETNESSEKCLKNHWMSHIQHQLTPIKHDRKRTPTEKTDGQKHQPESQEISFTSFASMEIDLFSLCRNVVCNGPCASTVALDGNQWPSCRMSMRHLAHGQERRSQLLGIPILTHDTRSHIKCDASFSLLDGWFSYFDDLKYGIITNSQSSTLIIRRIINIYQYDNMTFPDRR